MNIKKAILRGLSLSGASMMISNAGANEQVIENALDIANQR